MGSSARTVAGGGGEGLGRKEGGDGVLGRNGAGGSLCVLHNPLQFSDEGGVGARGLPMKKIILLKGGELDGVGCELLQVEEMQFPHERPGIPLGHRDDEGVSLAAGTTLLHPQKSCEVLFCEGSFDLDP